MAEKKICIIAKTYPRPSAKYDELVCTAGITENGEWIRLYPIPFRKLMLNKQYSKFHWIKCDVKRNESDFRPESHKLVTPDSIDIIGNVSTDKNGTWIARRDLLLKNVYYNLDTLISDAYDAEKKVSLAVFKPTRMLSFTTKESDSLSDIIGIFSNALASNSCRIKDNPVIPDFFRTDIADTLFKHGCIIVHPAQHINIKRRAIDGLFPYCEHQCAFQYQSLVIRRLAEAV
jgi:hypothetical protein